MDATTTALLITTLAALFGNIVKSHYDERNRRLEREQDRLDRQASALLTAQHREMMAAKLDENTKVTAETKEKASEAADTLKAVTSTVLKAAGDQSKQ